MNGASLMAKRQYRRWNVDLPATGYRAKGQLQASTSAEQAWVLHGKPRNKLVCVHYNIKENLTFIALAHVLQAASSCQRTHLWLAGTASTPDRKALHCRG
jgi:hypothetical protein